MKFMVIVKAGKDCEAGKLPSKEVLAAMGKYNEELANAGVLLALEGLQPSSKGARVKFAGKTRTVTDGPFVESKEFLAGVWVWDVPDLDVALKLAAEASKVCDRKIEVRPFL